MYGHQDGLFDLQHHYPAAKSALNERGGSCLGPCMVINQKVHLVGECMESELTVCMDVCEALTTGKGRQEECSCAFTINVRESGLRQFSCNQKKHLHQVKLVGCC